MKNKFYQHYRLLLYTLKNSKQLGLRSIHSCSFCKDAAQYLVQNALILEGTSSEEVVKCVDNLLDGDNLKSYQLAPDKFYSRSTNIVDLIVSNRNNLVINSWSVGLIITLAVLYLMK